MKLTKKTITTDGCFIQYASIDGEPELEVVGKCYFDGFSIDELLDRVSLSEVKEYIEKQEALNDDTQSATA